jgi:hypothetical protein
MLDLKTGDRRDAMQFCPVCFPNSLYRIALLSVVLTSSA